MEPLIHLFVRDNILSDADTAKMTEIRFVVTEKDGQKVYQAVEQTNEILMALVESEVLLIVLLPLETDA